MSNNSNLFDCSEIKFVWRVRDAKTKRMKNRVRMRPLRHSPSKNLIPRGTMKEVFTVRHITDLQATRAFVLLINIL